MCVSLFVVCTFVFHLTLTVSKQSIEESRLSCLNVCTPVGPSADGSYANVCNKCRVAPGESLITVEDVCSLSVQSKEQQGATGGTSSRCEGKVAPLW